MYTKASPGLLHIAPSLEKKDGYTEAAAVVGSADGVSAAGETTTADAAMKEAGGSTEISTDALSGSSTAVPPLRVGFVSRFFGDQVRQFVNLALKPQKSLSEVDLKLFAAIFGIKMSLTSRSSFIYQR